MVIILLKLDWIHMTASAFTNNQNAIWAAKALIKVVMT